jgi:hypothetical protein
MMRLTILFWNYNTRKGSLMLEEPNDMARAAVLARVARHHMVDILVVCECSIDSNILLAALQAEDSLYEAPLNPRERFK